VCALLLKPRDELKAGNLSVRYSKRFARLEEFFIDDRHWQGMREDFFRRSGLPSDTKQVPEYLARRLGKAYERTNLDADGVRRTLRQADRAKAPEERERSLAEFAKLPAGSTSRDMVLLQRRLFGLSV
jgi:hypothetical protein